MTKRVSLSKSAKKFDSVFFDVECQPTPVVVHTLEVVSAFTETDGPQLLDRPACTALVVIDGQGVIDHDLDGSSKAPTRKAIEMVRLALPAGSKVKGGYIYTPEWEGKTRWFALKDVELVDDDSLDDGEMVILAKKPMIKARGMLHLITA